MRKYSKMEMGTILFLEVLFKGAVRAQMERIALYLDCFELIDDAFWTEE